jgi:hypothetical protein
LLAVLVAIGAIPVDAARGYLTLVSWRWMARCGR